MDWVQKKCEQSLGSNDVFKAKIFHSLGASVDVADENNITLFHKVAAIASPAVVGWCLEKVSDVGREDNCGFTALHYAAGLGRADVVRIFYEKGVVVRGIKYTPSPLHLAIGSTNNVGPEQRVKTVEALLMHGVNPNVLYRRPSKEYYGSEDPRTPLMEAIAKSQPGIIRLLVEYGAIKYLEKYPVDYEIQKLPELQQSICLHALLSSWRDEDGCKERLLFSLEPKIISFVRAYGCSLARCIDEQTVLYEAVKWRGRARGELRQVRKDKFQKLLHALFEPHYSTYFYDEAQQRIKTFLLCNRRLPQSQCLLKDLIPQILIHIPAFIYNAKLLQLCLPLVRENNALAFAQQCSTKLLRKVVQNVKGDKAAQILGLQDKHAKHLCSVQDKHGKTAYDLAVQYDDGIAASLVDPSTTKVIK